MGELKKRVQRIETLPEVEGDVGPISVIEVRHAGWQDMTPDEIAEATEAARKEAAEKGWQGPLQVDLPPASWRKAKEQQRDQASK